MKKRILGLCMAGFLAAGTLIQPLETTQAYAAEYVLEHTEVTEAEDSETEDAGNIEDKEETEDIENIEDKKEIEDTEKIEDKEETEDIKDIEKQEIIENSNDDSQEINNTESLEVIEATEDTAGTELIENEEASNDKLIPQKDLTDDVMSEAVIGVGDIVYQGVDGALTWKIDTYGQLFVTSV